MTLLPSDQRHLDAASGFVDLGLFLEANKELDEMEPVSRALPALALRMEICCGLNKWDLMLEISKRLHEFQPNKIQWLLSYAFASRRALSIEVAKEILLKSVSKFPRKAVIYFNLACYECQLGQLNSAREYLKRAFEIDPSWRLEALDDEDLEPIWNAL